MKMVKTCKLENVKGRMGKRRYVKILFGMEILVIFYD